MEQICEGSQLVCPIFVDILDNWQSRQGEQGFLAKLSLTSHRAFAGGLEMEREAGLSRPALWSPFSEPASLLDSLQTNQVQLSANKTIWWMIQQQI